LKRWVTRVVLLPVLLAALLPSVVMPVVDRDGLVTVVICSGSGPLELLVDARTGLPAEPGAGDAGDAGDTDQSGAGDRGYCSWNLQHQAALADDAAPAVQPLVFTLSTIAAGRDQLPSAILSGILPPARAPPFPV
jgi:hypothetical protein